MKLLDNLKKIFEAKFSDFLNGNRFSLFDFSRNTTYVLEEKKKGVLSIDVSKATPEENRLIKEKFLDVNFQEKGFLLTDKSSEKTSQIKENLPKGDDKKLLQFYKDKLSPEMYDALDASLVIRNAFKKGEDILELKIDVIKKYPTFGNNLCNLSSQGYFEDHFKQMYDKMFEEDGFDIRLYQEKVEWIIKSLPYTVFITKHKTLDELSGEVKFKLEKLRRYGMNKLLLHGLGKENVDTGLKIIGEYKEDKTLDIEKDINPRKTIINATFKFV